MTTPLPLSVQTLLLSRADGKFTLKVALGGREKTFAVKKGDNAFAISAPSL